MSEEFDAQAFLRECSTHPGVYRMLDVEGQVLYVGKARNLRSRLSSYFQNRVDSAKTRALVARIQGVDTTVTGSEAEALLLEQGQIKKLRPPYNILLRDDKSYPFIKLTVDQDWPRIAFHRGSRRGGARYFGPYPNSGAVRETLNLIEKVFQLRNCSDSYFLNRDRPCLQHQIGRCTAPCVGRVSDDDYRRQVDMAVAFLEGRDQELTRELEQRMEAAAEAQDYETAAQLRDQIASIRAVQQKQYVDTDAGDVDVVACRSRHGVAVVEVLFVRNGRVLGNRAHVPRSEGEITEADVLEAFLPQYYLGDNPVAAPPEVIVDRELSGLEALRQAVAEHQGRQVRFAARVRGQRRRWQELAERNVEESLNRQLAARESLEKRFATLNRLLESEDDPVNRIECFDISHTRGEKPVASCVVFQGDGPAKNEYRRFNVAPPAEGDDYAALAEAVRRRYQRIVRESGRLPDLVLIDGGKGQISRICSVLEELDLTDHMLLLGISKGPSRKPGLEVLHRASGREIAPGSDDPGLHLLQQIRDEAHRFAITGHRQKRGKASQASSLEDIPGVGAGRRRALLRHFGGLAQLRNASVEALADVPGISRNLAETLYAWLHD